MDKLCRVSEYLEASHADFEKYGIYDGYANTDSELYINPKLLKRCTIAELKGSYNKVVSHFMKIMDFLRKMIQCI